MLVTDESADAFADGLDPRPDADRRDPTVIRAHAERFSRDRFMTNFQAAVAGRASTERRGPRDDAAVQPPARRSSSSSATRCISGSSFALAYLLRFHWLADVIPVTKGYPPFEYYGNLLPFVG